MTLINENFKHPKIPGHYAFCPNPPSTPTIHSSPDFLTDLARTTAAVTEEFNNHADLNALFKRLHDKDHLPDGHRTRLGVCAQIGFELTLASYDLIANHGSHLDWPGVFEYEVPPTFLARYFQATKRIPLGNLPSPKDIRAIARQVVKSWFCPDPVWVVHCTGADKPLTVEAPHFENLIHQLNLAEIPLDKITEIRQVPDGTD